MTYLNVAGHQSLLSEASKPIDPFLTLNPHGIPLNQAFRLQSLDVEIDGWLVPLTELTSDSYLPPMVSLFQKLERKISRIRS